MRDSALFAAAYANRHEEGARGTFSSRTHLLDHGEITSREASVNYYLIEVNRELMYSFSFPSVNFVSLVALGSDR